MIKAAGRATPTGIGLFAVTTKPIDQPGRSITPALAANIIKGGYWLRPLDQIRARYWLSRGYG